MTSNRRVRAVALSTLAAAGIAAGASAGVASAHDHAHMHMKRVTIRFAALSGTAPVSCAAPVTGLGTKSTTAALQDLRFYISNVRLTRANGTSVPLRLAGGTAYNLTAGGNRVTLIDLENGKGSCTEGDARTNAAITGWVPTGRYAGVRMYMGVPFALNHSDVALAKAPLDLTAMDWGWQSGRKFAKIELVDPAGAAGTWSAKAFFVHLGSTGCSGNPASGATVSCTASNRVQIRLRSFDPATQKVAIDLRTLMAGDDITVNGGGAPGCMSGPTDPECPAVFSALGLSGTAQTAFRAIAR